MGLFAPKWMSNDVGKALRAAEKITDPQKLAEVAVHAKLQLVAGKAVERIHEEAVLSEIAMGDADFFVVGKALERITRPDLLKRLADEAAQDWVRVTALNRLIRQNRSVDLTPYKDLVERCVEGGSVEAVALCKDRALLEKIYLNTPRWSMNEEQQRKVKGSVRERINQLASETVRGRCLPNELERFVDGRYVRMYSDDVRKAAQAKLNAMVLPGNASQEELYRAAVNNPAVREKALSRLSDPELLAKVARSRQFPPETRVRIAEKAGIGNPFGTRTLVCPKCGSPAVYRERYESIDSWNIEKDFICRNYRQGCARCGADDPLRSFAVGDAKINWKGDLTFVCPSCGRNRKAAGSAAFLKRCDCGSTEAPIPVEYQFG